MAQFKNTATATGTFENTLVSAESDLFIDLTALEIVKTADKNVWVQGELEYTLTITNLDESDPGEDVINVVIEDVIPTAYVHLLEETIKIDGGDPPVGSYDYIDGVLTVRIGDVVKGTPRTVSFKVDKPT